MVTDCQKHKSGELHPLGQTQPATPFGEGGWGVRVTAASRLSFTLIDLNGETGRRNGMASLSLKAPSFQALLRPAKHLSLETEEHAVHHVSAIQTFLQTLQQRWAGPPVQVSIQRGLPANAGFGSKTTTLMALGKAYAVLCGKEADTGELARIAGRGGTSGASVNLIERGGFLVDGGHANPDDFDADPRRYLMPSRFAGVYKIPPVLINLPFPPWPILAIMSGERGLYGKAELEWFHRVVPIPAAEARRTAHLILMNLAPAVAEADYRAFCRAVNELTHETYYKQQQIAAQSKDVQTLIHDAARRSDVDAFGMSSMGPMCYAFTRQPKSVVAWLEELQMAGRVHSFWFTNAQNHPAVIESVPVHSI
jgi:beta-ribofuranosylaminobenzene 5'-phosphate synthase